MNPLNLFRGPQHRVMSDKSYFTYFNFRGDVPRVGDYINPPEGPRLKVVEVLWHRYNDSDRLIAWVFVDPQV